MYKSASIWTKDALLTERVAFWFKNTETEMAREKINFFDWMNVPTVAALRISKYRVSWGGKNEE
jgi:hypothetical protein